MANENQQQQPEDPRAARAQRRADRIKRANEGRFPKRVRVVPRDDIIRRDIRHQPDGLRFPKQGSVEWPLDQFTKRRLAEGVVMLEGAQAQKSREENRERSRAQHRQQTSSHS